MYIQYPPKKVAHRKIKMGVAGLSLTYTRPMPQFSPILIFFFKIINYVKKNLVFSRWTSLFSILMNMQHRYSGK